MAEQTHVKFVFDPKFIDLGFETADINNDSQISKEEFQSLFKWLFENMRTACKVFVDDYEK